MKVDGLDRDDDSLFELIQTLYERRAMGQIGSVSLVLDHSGCIAYYNLPAQQVLAAGDGLSIDEQGKLAAAQPASAQRLERVIQQALAIDPGEDGRSPHLVKVDRPSGKPPYLLFLWPCLAGETGPNHDSGLLVVINDPEHSELTIQQMLTQLYHLTPTEAQVAMLLLEGKSAKEIAEARKVAISTVRTQIRNLLMKTDTQRQSEFIALVFRCLSLLLR